MNGSRRPVMLLVGDASYGSNFTSYVKAFLRLGFDCEVFDVSPYTRPSARSMARVSMKLRHGELSPSTMRQINERVARLGRALRPDATFAFKALWLHGDTVDGLPTGVKIHFHPDDSSNPAETSQMYLDAQPVWDLHVTNRVCNIEELRLRGARDVLRVYAAYDRDWHRPIVRNGEPQYAVTFIGTRRSDRAGLIDAFAEEYRKRFLLCGGKWGRSRKLVRLASVRPAQYGVALSEAVSSAAACLGLLNSDNRDLHNYRTFEMTAAGGLLVGERTEDHRELFVENEEAFLFSSYEEAHEIVCRVASDRALRERVAGAGHRRVVSGGNSYEHRAAAILAHVELTPPSGEWLRKG